MKRITFFWKPLLAAMVATFALLATSCADDAFLPPPDNSPPGQSTEAPEATPLPPSF
ncbi:MAG: hypothetical protein ACR2G0_00745 [Chthoniobacterales bacterium]